MSFGPGVCPEAHKISLEISDKQYRLAANPNTIKDDAPSAALLLLFY
jgi:hypothetical protein